MNPFTLNGDKTELEPITFDNFDKINRLIAKEDVRKLSLIYNSLSLIFSAENIERIIEEPSFSNNSNIYIINKKENSETIGIIGITDIDWPQQRANLFFLMDSQNIKTKQNYEPIKILLNRAIIEWNLRKLIMPVFSDDATILTVLKGFGFTNEGVLKEYVRWKDEYLDVNIMGLLKNEFRSVDY